MRRNSRSLSRAIAGPLMPAVAGFGASMIVKNMAAASIAFETAFNGTEIAFKCAIIVITESNTLEVISV